MNKRSLITLAIVALVGLLAVPFIYAQQAPAPREHGMGMHGMGMHGDKGMQAFGPLGHLQKLQTELGLSDAQVTEIKTIFTNLRDQNAAYRTQLKGGHQAILSTLLKDPNDLASAQAILNQQTQAENAMKANVLSATSKALNVLTADQRAKLADLIAQRQANRAARMSK